MTPGDDDATGCIGENSPCSSCGEGAACKSTREPCGCSASTAGYGERRRAARTRCTRCGSHVVNDLSRLRSELGIDGGGDLVARGRCLALAAEGVRRLLGRRAERPLLLIGRTGL
eukprot:3486020-Prymnesium_polylepis.1